MENASKALLIAGAVLLVIAIIAIGMGVFGTARGVIGQAEGQIDNMSVQMHNKQFEAYQKTTLTGQEAKELVSLAITNNQSTTTRDFRIELEVDNEDGVSYFYITQDNYIESYQYYPTGLLKAESNKECVLEFEKIYNNVDIEYNSKGIIYYIYIY